MFRDRVFNISFVISLCGHLFCIFAFVLVISPKGFSLNAFPATAFLGPILEEGLLQPGYNLKPAVMPTPYKEDFTSSDLFSASDYTAVLSLPAYTLDDINFEELHMVKQLPDITVGKGDDKD